MNRKQVNKTKEEEEEEEHEDRPEMHRVKPRLTT